MKPQTFPDCQFSPSVFPLCLCPPVTARGPGCLQGPEIRKPLSVCGMSAVSSWESSGSSWCRSHGFIRPDPCHDERGPKRWPTLKDCPTGWLPLLLQSLPTRIFLTFLEVFVHPTLTWGWLMAQDTPAYKPFLETWRVGNLLGQWDWADPTQAGNGVGRAWLGNWEDFLTNT